MKKKSKIQERPVRHNSLIVTLHWLIALIILAEALIGVGILHFWPNTAVKVAPLTLHMILGISLLVLVVVQIVVRFATARPAQASTGSPFLDFVARATHALLYLFTLLMGGSGILLALQSHVLGLVVGRAVAQPMGFEPFVHAAIFVLFGLLVGLHVLGALFHQLILKDRLFSRMGYPKRSSLRRPIQPAGRAVDNL